MADAVKRDGCGGIPRRYLQAIITGDLCRVIFNRLYVLQRVESVSGEPKRYANARNDVFFHSI